MLSRVLARPARDGEAATSSGTDSSLAETVPQSSQPSRLTETADSPTTPAGKARGRALEDQELTPGALPAVDGYQIIRPLGRGGMGVVYEALQKRPVRRPVALKVLRADLGTAELAKRFDSERQALALMSHPNIAQVYDAGSSLDGAPYFAMELVRGQPLDRYCDDHALSARERLDLFIRVCDGVQHAHQRTILHRDLKPANVLVTTVGDRAQPKIIDFGLAKAIGRVPETALPVMETIVGEFLGTLMYASPEQVLGSVEDLDTRSDVFSLGVILYLLLTGRLPFVGDDEPSPDAVVLRQRLEVDDVVRPSTRVARLARTQRHLARHRSTTPESLPRQLEGDLDWIVLKALAKERDDRYGSAGELAADLRRYLDDQPILARPPSRMYRFRKFVRRHRVGVAFGTLIVVSLVAFGILTVVQSRRVAREAETAQRVSDFLVELFEVSNPNESAGADLTARELLDRGAQRIRTELDGEPVVKARLLHLIANVYQRLTLHSTAEPLLDEALALASSLYGERSLEVAAILRSQAAAHKFRAEDESAHELYVQVLETRRRHLSDDHPDVLESLGNLTMSLANLRRYEEAEPLQRELVQVLRQQQQDGPPNENIVRAIGNLASTLFRLDRNVEADPLFVEALDLASEVHEGQPNTQSSMLLSNYSLCLRALERYDEAEAAAQKSLEMSEALVGPLSNALTGPLFALAELRDDLEKPAEAVPLYRRLVEIDTHNQGRQHQYTAQSLRALGQALRRVGSTQALEEAERYLRESLAITRAVAGDRDRESVRTLQELGLSLAEQGLEAQAREHLQTALDIEAEADPESERLAELREAIAGLPIER